MQVSAAEGWLLVVATKGGTGLGDRDQKELEDLINEVLQKAGGSGTSSPTTTSPTKTRATGTSSPDGSSSPAKTGPASTATSSPSPTAPR